MYFFKLKWGAKMKPDHVKYLVEDTTIHTNDNKTVQVWKLTDCHDESVLQQWASYFRNHYCSEEEIDKFRAGYNFSRQEYLEKIKFPEKGHPLGNAARSGDFCEVLVADYVEFIMNFYVPRTRYDRKVNPNSSTQGSDLLAFKVNVKKPSDDELLVFEVKAQASNTAPQNKLQEAIEHSKKDTKRLAFSLNAINQRLCEKGLLEKAALVQRFQNATDRPYKENYGAAAVHSDYSYSEDLIKDVSTGTHINPDLHMIVIHKENLMDFIHELYRRATLC